MVHCVENPKLTFELVLRSKGQKSLQQNLDKKWAITTERKTVRFFLEILPPPSAKRLLQRTCVMTTRSKITLLFSSVFVIGTYNSRTKLLRKSKLGKPVVHGNIINVAIVIE